MRETTSRRWSSLWRSTTIRESRSRPEAARGWTRMGEGLERGVLHMYTCLPLGSSTNWAYLLLFVASLLRALSASYLSLPFPLLIVYCPTWVFVFCSTTCCLCSGGILQRVHSTTTWPFFSQTKQWQGKKWRTPATQFLPKRMLRSKMYYGRCFTRDEGRTILRVMVWSVSSRTTTLPTYTQCISLSTAHEVQIQTLICSPFLYSWVRKNSLFILAPFRA